MSKFRDEINLILSAIQSGDETKAQELFIKTYTHLKVIALRYSFDKNDYEDILVESYFRIFKYIHTFDKNKDGYNWMCRIVQNVATDFNKDVKPFFLLNDTDIVFSDLEIDTVNKNDLMRELRLLSREDQQLLYLRFWQDLSYGEISKILNKRKSFIHKRVHILINKIKNKLKD